jgi:hypothetical protein
LGCEVNLGAPDCYNPRNKGEWQERISQALAPHFEFKAIKYLHYRWFGATKLVLEPWIVAAIPAEVVLARQFRLFDSSREQLVICAGLAILAFLFAPLRREWALRSVARQMDEVTETPGPKYLVAHSLGTYLSAMAMQKFANVQFHSAILTGCVLSRRFDWPAIQVRGKTLQRISNEVAGSDRVPQLAFFLAGLVPSMEHSGRFGFAGKPEMVHSLTGPLEECPLCAPPQYALVHNIVSKEMRHSDHFITTGYAFKFWLPFFWNIPAGEFQELLQLCEESAAAEEARAFGAVVNLERKMHRRSWRWREGATKRTLPDFMREEIRDRLDFQGMAHPSEAVLDDWIKLGVLKFWRTIAAASRGERNARLLYPPSAVTAAVDELMENWPLPSPAAGQKLSDHG